MRKAIQIPVVAESDPSDYLGRLKALAEPLQAMDSVDVRQAFGLTKADRLLKTTLSLCPACLRHVPAAVFERGDAVMLRQRCAEHGLALGVIENDRRYYHLSNKDQWGRRYAEERVFEIPDFSASGGCCGGSRSCAEPAAAAPWPFDFADQRSNKSCTVLVEVTGAVGMVLGSLMVQILIATSGGRAALVGVAATLTVVLALSYRAVRHADRSATVPVVAIRLLRELPAFTHLQAPALEGVARAATEMPVTAGTEVIREGDTGDRFYAVVDGRVRVEMGGRFKRHIQRGDGFGEIALLADVPRIATVTAETDTLLLAIEREPFLLAVTGNDAATVASWGAVDRMDTEGVLDHLHRDP